MATETAIIGGVVQPVSSYLMESLRYFKRKYDRAKKLDENWEKLEHAEKDLESMKVDVENEISRDQITKELTSQCEAWLKDVKDASEKVINLKSKYDNSNKTYCGLSSLFSLSKLSKDMTLLTAHIIILRDRIKLHENVVTDKFFESFIDQFPENTDKFPSLTQTVDKLLNLLRDRDLKKIGVYGMAGVGKTTIMKNLNNKVSGTGLFDIVIFIPVEVFEVRRIQDVLVERLKLYAEGNISDCEVARRISKRLENEKYLLLLDKVRSKIDLEELGIYDIHKHGKVVVASRSRIICDDIGVQELIQVERMSHDDALQLFQHTTGDVANNARIREVAEKITKECGGVPQVIKIVATTLKYEKNEFIWWHILSRLRSSKWFLLKNCDDLFGDFELAYDKLEDYMKKCLLYGAMFPGDYEIYEDYLMECWRAEEFIPVVQPYRATSNTQLFRMARNEGHYTLKILTSACLLERCKRVKYVKMPLIFRRWALRIANQVESSSMVTAVEEMEEQPTEEEWRNAKMISLMCSNLSALPERPECEKITSLFLHKNGSLNRIPPQFFDCMSKLLVLNLCYTGIPSLPTSVSELISLKALYLNYCNQLHKLPAEISKLQHLEILDTRCSGILSVPKEIGDLVGLKCLRISFTGHIHNHNNVEGQKVETIPIGVVGRLCSLEELTIEVDFNARSWNDVVDTISKEVATLKVLNALDFYFPKLDCFAEFFKNSISWNNKHWGSSSGFRSFRILVGSSGTHYQHEIDMSGCRGERHLKFFAGNHSVAEITTVLDQACTFELIGDRTVNNLTNFGINNMRGLETCVVQECNKMRSIIDCNNITGAALPELVRLHLINLEVLRCIWVGSITPESLANLVTLTIYGCPQLKEILSNNLARYLPRLQILRVENCSGSTSVIEEVEITEDVKVLPKLERLELVKLPQLVRISDQDNLFKWDSLKEIVIDDCERLCNLPLIDGNAEQLKLIECRQSWWDTLDLMDREVKRHLQGFCQFIPLR